MTQEARLPTFDRQSGGENVCVEWKESDTSGTSLLHLVSGLVSTGLPRDGPQTTIEVMQELDKIKRSFLWAGNKAISSGKCKVNRTKTTLPNEQGGLGVLDLEKFARVLRLRWLW
jgi:hypothetical protein